MSEKEMTLDVNIMKIQGQNPKFLKQDYALIVYICLSPIYYL